MTTVFKYGLALRPAGIGCIPKGLTFTLEPGLTDPRGSQISRHGIIVFDRPLTDEEIYSFDLCLIASDELTAQLVEKIVAEKAEYAHSYTGMYETDRAYFDQAVRDQLKRMYRYHVFIADETAFIDAIGKKLKELAVA